MKSGIQVKKMFDGVEDNKPMSSTATLQRPGLESPAVPHQPYHYHWGKDLCSIGLMQRVLTWLHP